MSIREEMGKCVDEAKKKFRSSAYPKEVGGEGLALGFLKTDTIPSIVRRAFIAGLRASNLAGPEKKKPKMRMMWYCPKCDYDRHPVFSLNENGGYCPDCGKKLIQRESIDCWEYGDEEFNEALTLHASEVEKEAGGLEEGV